MFYVEGIQNIKDALANEWEIDAFIYSEETELSQWAKSVLNKANLNYVLSDTLQADSTIYDCDLSTPVLLLVGNETNGLTHYYTETADERIIIPMNEGIDSLNVACATTVCLYEINRQRAK